MAMAYAAKPSYSDLLVSVFGLVSVVLLLAQPGTSLMKHEPAVTCRLGGEDDDGKHAAYSKRKTLCVYCTVLSRVVCCVWPRLRFLRPPAHDMRPCGSDLTGSP